MSRAAAAAFLALLALLQPARALDRPEAGLERFAALTEEMCLGHPPAPGFGAEQHQRFCTCLGEEARAAIVDNVAMLKTAPADQGRAWMQRMVSEKAGVCIAAVQGK